MKTLKQEEIYLHHYRDLEHLRSNVEVFMNSITIGAAYTLPLVICLRKSSSKAYRQAVSPRR